MAYRGIRGNQPDGQMNVAFSEEHLPGYEGHGTIIITYIFHSGTQGVDHPNPGQPYEGTTIYAFLPDCREGKGVLKLLRVAFDRKLIFTIRRSSIAGQDDVVTLNDIHHKTEKDGGPIRFGYPDPSYLQQVREELARKGVTEPKSFRTQDDKEQHRSKSMSKNLGAIRRPKKKEDQTVDTKNSEDSSVKDICPICLEEIKDPKQLDKCGHVFCHGCINASFKQFNPVCPRCYMVYGEIRGNQPDGQMNVAFSEEHLPGYEGHGTIIITYNFPSGMQGVDHPNPGQPYEGTTIYAFLPDCREGKGVLKLLRVAFDRKLIFTIRRSSIAGQDDVVTLNDIHHKTEKYGGPIRFGYPDPSYLQQVREELARKGVTEPKSFRTQDDKEQHRSKSMSKNLGAIRRPKKKEDQTVDTKNSEDSSVKDICPICLEEIKDPKQLDKCGHVFCHGCINASFKQFNPVCPRCYMVYGEIRGNQPDGQMNVAFSEEHLPGYEGHGTIIITYNFPSGTQGVDHPNPGQPYEETTIYAFLPDCREGKDVLKLLRKAFDRKLTCTIEQSTTTGQDDVVTLNDIHHKTKKDGGPIRFGYPDPSYLQQVREELARKGVTALHEPKRVRRPMLRKNPGVMSTKVNMCSPYPRRFSVLPHIRKVENQKKFADELKKLKEVARKKGFTVKESDNGQDLLTALSDQLSYVLREEIEPEHLRTVVARYLRTQSGKESNLGNFLIGTSLEAVITLIEKEGDVDCQIFLNAASNSFGVEILLIFESGEEICFQPFLDTEFLPSLALGTVSNTRYFSLEHGPAVPDLPSTWSRSSKETELVTLQPHSQEFKEVEQSFRSSIGRSKNHSVIQIKRVQSITPWRCFKITRDQIAKRCPDITTESLLWHGTSETVIKPICKSGFNRSYCGKHGILLGKGVYFSRASEYAARDTYSAPGSDGAKFMFRARVLTGHYTKGTKDLKDSPWLDERELLQFDSVVDNVDKPTMFAIFHDNKAYPEYLIKFK